MGQASSAMKCFVLYVRHVVLSNIYFFPFEPSLYKRAHELYYIIKEAILMCARQLSFLSKYVSSFDRTQ